MTPFTVTITSLGVSVTNIIVVFSWLVFSLLFWRALRNVAIDEDRIFDLTFYATVIGIVFARLGYVFVNRELFFGKSLLLIPAMWVLPGFSWLAGLIGALGALVVLSRQYKVRLGLVLDAIAAALPLPILFGEVGSLLGGLEAGRVTRMPWGIRLGSDPAIRHPVQFYEMIGLVFLIVLMIRLTGVAVKKKWPYGILGVSFLFWYAVLEFVLEFLKETRVYWGNLSANQWVLIGIFAECVGVLYVRGGGREKMRPLVTRSMTRLEAIRKGMYGFFSRKHTN